MQTCFVEHSLITNKALIRIGDMLAQKAVTEPLKAKVCYHEAEDTPTGVKFKQLHHIVFCPANKAKVNPEGGGEDPDPEEGGGGPSSLQSTAANLVPHNSLQGDCTATVFAVKWTVQGIQPVRPLVVMTKALTVPPSNAAKLN